VGGWEVLARAVLLEVAVIIGIIVTRIPRPPWVTRSRPLHVDIDRTQLIKPSGRVKSSR
jgi:hypothetical protein